RADLISAPKLNVGQVIRPLNLLSLFSSGTTLSPANPPCATSRPKEGPKFDPNTGL
ncbi:unnamed protein product, partial [Didymodactylos carnosus]